jgi:hypothetical protein
MGKAKLTAVRGQFPGGASVEAGGVLFAIGFQFRRATHCRWVALFKDSRR